MRIPCNTDISIGHPPISQSDIDLLLSQLDILQCLKQTLCLCCLNWISSSILSRPEPSAVSTGHLPVSQADPTLRQRTACVRMSYCPFPGQSRFIWPFLPHLKHSIFAKGSLSFFLEIFNGAFCADKAFFKLLNSFSYFCAEATTYFLLVIVLFSRKISRRNSGFRLFNSLQALFFSEIRVGQSFSNSFT
jgi:hypothetical protein